MSAEEYFRLVSSEQYRNLWVQWIQWIKSLNDLYFGLVLDAEYIPLSDYNSNGQHLGPEGALRPILNTSLSQKLCLLK